MQWQCANNNIYLKIMTVHTEKKSWNISIHLPICSKNNDQNRENDIFCLDISILVDLLRNSTIVPKYFSPLFFVCLVKCLSQNTNALQFKQVTSFIKINDCQISRMSIILRFKTLSSTHFNSKLLENISNIPQNNSHSKSLRNTQLSWLICWLNHFVT